MQRIYKVLRREEDGKLHKLGFVHAINHEEAMSKAKREYGHFVDNYKNLNVIRIKRDIEALISF